ncbi:MAG: superoxide dismutase [marine bacterium B5-7]|nr:MAG: superoxide dismutase [marine bacterium B5-7]
MSGNKHTNNFTPGMRIVKPIPFKAHKVKTMSAEMIETHFETFYGGGVCRLNEIEERIATRDWIENSDPDIQSIKQAELTALNDVILHEIYFECLGDESEEGRELNADCNFAHAITASFGSLDQWQMEFKALAGTMTGGSGWVLLVWSKYDNRMINVMVNNQQSLLLDASSILALDMYAHAYQSDFGSDIDAYISAFVQAIHWGRVAKRFDRLMTLIADDDRENFPPKSISVGDLKKMVDEGEGSTVILDVRHVDDRQRYRTRIMQTPWRDSHHVSSWSDELPKDKPIVVYCMYGFWVSQDVALELREKGYDARTLEGGIVSWRAMGYDSTDIEN